ncbi:hypothetical protein [Neptunomonas phycophila]|uniref:hypothetical protein n=1 Tax=Neptunomonas phycophila TaxID=1572645 RepID=UPI0030FAF066
MYLYSNGTDFLISKKEVACLPSDFMFSTGDSILFGYAFVEGRHFKNEIINNAGFDYIKNNNIDISGIFCCVSGQQGSLEIIVDPLLQFNIFFYAHGDCYLVSSNIDVMLKVIGVNNLTYNKDYLFDQFAYQSPMRGGTIFNEITLLTFDDLKGTSPVSKINFKDLSDFLKIHKPHYNKYNDLSYESLLMIYIERLNNRAKVISDKFSEVHIQLTGGADSRLVMSAFQKFENTFAYVYGNGENQNRLIFEELTRARAIKKVSEIKLVGKPLNSPATICKGLIDTSFLKLNNLNTYMNASFDESDKVCKVTGYYGANVCGGVVLPPENTIENPRLSLIPSECFTYHDYVAKFKEININKRKASFSDLFYINNRGKSHYASHSLADNKNINSVDILYDYINILLVDKCPYPDVMIDKNAISIDLISLNDHQLALFPYDSRKIPKYRDFDNIPIINCFDGYNFLSRDLENFKVSHPVLNIGLDEIYEGFNAFGTIKDMLGSKAFDDFFNEHSYFGYLRNKNDIQAGIFLYYCISVVYFNSLKK